MKAIELGYVAGFFDGEGTIGSRITDRGYRIYKLSIGQTCPEPLYFIHKVMGVGGVDGPYDRGKHKPIWFYRVSRREDVSRFIRLIRPYVQVKGADIDKVLQLMSENPRVTSAHADCNHPRNTYWYRKCNESHF
jgi:hypothetical protein